MAAIHKNKRNAADNSEEIVYPCYTECINYISDVACWLSKVLVNHKYSLKQGWYELYVVKPKLQRAAT